MDNMARATVKYVRISPRKVKIVLTLFAISPLTRPWRFSATRPKRRVSALASC